MLYSPHSAVCTVMHSTRAVKVRTNIVRCLRQTDVGSFGFGFNRKVRGNEEHRMTCCQTRGFIITLLLSEMFTSTSDTLFWSDTLPNFSYFVYFIFQHYPEPRWSFCYFLLPFLMIMYFHKNYITPYLPDANACLRLHNIHTKLYSGILYSDITVIHCKHYCDDSSLVVTVSCKQTVICFFKDTKNLLYFPKSAARNSQ